MATIAAIETRLFHGRIHPVSIPRLSRVDGGDREGEGDGESGKNRVIAKEESDKIR